MRNTSVSLALLLVIGTGCNGKGTSVVKHASYVGLSAPESIDDPDAYAIYNALLGGSGNPDALHGTIAIKRETGDDKVCSDFQFQTWLHPRLSEAIEDYADQNSKSRFLKKEKFNLGRSVELVPRSELDSIFSEGLFAGWAKFNSLHPNAQGYVELSAVGFSADRSFAVAYSAARGGPKAGAGGFSTFSRTNGIWRENPGRSCFWIA